MLRLCLLLLWVGAAVNAQTFTPVRDDGKSTGRIVVKLRPEMAARVEQSLPMATMSLSLPAASDAAVAGFMVGHGVLRLAPMHPGMVRQKKARGWSGMQLAAEVRRRYAARAARMRDSFQPPDVSRIYVLELGAVPADTVRQALAALRTDPAVEYAEEDGAYQTSGTVNDPYFSSAHTWNQPYDDLWGIKQVGAPGAWDLTTGAGVLVAVIDGGVDYNHPDIAANIWTNAGEVAGNGLDDDHNGFVDDIRGWDFVGPSATHPTQGNDPVDGSGHGTHVAGTVAALGNNGMGVVGVAYGARVMVLKGCDNNGQCPFSSLAAAIVYAADNGADVINASWGGPGTPYEIQEAVGYAYQLGVVFVAAAGNAASDVSAYGPANLPEAIAVAASDPYDQAVSFSNFGTKIDVAAPGVDILSLHASGTSICLALSQDPLYCRASGTSMAAPHVSGVAALILALHPDYGAEEVRQILRASATDAGEAGFDLHFGYGRLNAAAAAAIPNALQVKITAPKTGASLSSGTAITGTVGGTGLASYAVEYGAGELPSQWTVLASGTSPVSGTLATLTGVGDGWYTIRLSARDGLGNVFVDRVYVHLLNSWFSYPAMPRTPNGGESLKPDTTVNIRGTAAADPFSSYTIEWAPGLNPAADAWQSDGVTLTGGGLSPVYDSVLATWHVPANQYVPYPYSLRMVVKGGGLENTFITVVYLEPALLNGNWPKYLERKAYMNSGLVPRHNMDGSLSLMVEAPRAGLAAARMWWLAPDGATSSYQDMDIGTYTQPAVADMHEMAGDELAVANGTMVRLFLRDWYLMLDMGIWDNVDFSRNPVQLADVDGDGYLEILAIANDYTNNVAKLYAWDNYGTLLPGFPATLANRNPIRDWYNKVLFLAGDFSGNGDREIVAVDGTSASTFTLAMLDKTGARKSWTAPLFDGMPWVMAGADLDHNKAIEIVLGTESESGLTLHVLQPDGSERAGWPVAIPRTSQVLHQPAFLAMGDLKQDGQREIIIAWGSFLFVFSPNGQSYAPPFEYSVQTTFNTVTVADVTGDGYPDIVTSATGRYEYHDPLFTQPIYLATVVLALDRNLVLKNSWSLTAGSGCDLEAFPGITIGDFEGNGITDIGLTYGGSGCGGGFASVLTTRTTRYPEADEWPLTYRNTRNVPILADEPAAAPEFTFPSAPEPQRIVAGEAASFPLTLRGSGGFLGTVHLSCGGLPKYASCSFQPEVLGVGRSPATSNVIIQTTARQAVASSAGGAAALLLSAPLLGSVFLTGRPRLRRRNLALLATLVFLLVLAGCGGGGAISPPAGGGQTGTPAGTYNVVVTATSGTLSHSTTLKLTVQ